MRPFLYLLVMALAQAMAPMSLAANKVIVGYREDARPFVYLDEPDALVFKGFLADLCDQALDLAGYEIERIPVDARSRWLALNNNEVDMLCDTTSVTLKRTSERLFSPIIFLSGVSYVYSPQAEQAFLKDYSSTAKPDDNPSLEKVQTGDPDPAAVAPFCANQPKDLQPQLPPGHVPVMRVGVLNATTAETAVRNMETLRLFRLKPGEVICIESLIGNYSEGVDKLCSGKFAFFFGDRDMLQTYLADELKQRPECDAILSGKFFSYEPYALVVRSDRIDLALKLQNALFQLFSSGVAEKLFEQHFKGRPKTNLLQALFRINAIGRVE